MNSEKYSAKLETVKKIVAPEIEKIISDAVLKLANPPNTAYKNRLFKSGAFFCYVRLYLMIHKHN